MPIVPFNDLNRIRAYFTFDDNQYGKNPFRSIVSEMESFYNRAVEFHGSENFPFSWEDFKFVYIGGTINSASRINVYFHMANMINIPMYLKFFGINVEPDGEIDHSVFDKLISKMEKNQYKDDMMNLLQVVIAYFQARTIDDFKKINVPRGLSSPMCASPISNIKNTLVEVCDIKSLKSYLSHGFEDIRYSRDFDSENTDHILKYYKHLSQLELIKVIMIMMQYKMLSCGIVDYKNVKSFSASEISNIWFRENGKFHSMKFSKYAKREFAFLPEALVTIITEALKDEYCVDTSKMFIHEGKSRKAFAYAYGMSAAQSTSPSTDNNYALLRSSCMRSPVRRNNRSFGPTDKFSAICNSSEFYAKDQEFYNNGVNSAEIYASGDFSIIYISDKPDPFDPDAKIHSRTLVAHMKHILSPDGISEFAAKPNRKTFSVLGVSYITSEIDKALIEKYFEDKYGLNVHNQIPYLVNFSPIHTFAANFLRPDMSVDRFLRQKMVVENQFAKRPFRFKFIPFGKKSTTHDHISKIANLNPAMTRYHSIYMDIRRNDSITTSQEVKARIAHGDKTTFSSQEEMDAFLNAKASERFVHIIASPMDASYDVSSEQVLDFGSSYGQTSTLYIPSFDKIKCYLTGEYYFEHSIYRCFIYEGDPFSEKEIAIKRNVHLSQIGYGNNYVYNYCRGKLIVFDSSVYKTSAAIVYCADGYVDLVRVVHKKDEEPWIIVDGERLQLTYNDRANCYIDPNCEKVAEYIRINYY